MSTGLPSIENYFKVCSIVMSIPEDRHPWFTEVMNNDFGPNFGPLYIEYCPQFSTAAREIQLLTGLSV